MQEPGVRSNPGRDMCVSRVRRESWPYLFVTSVNIFSAVPYSSKRCRPEDKRTEPEDKRTRPEDKRTGPEDKRARPEDKRTRPEEKRTRPED